MVNKRTLQAQQTKQNILDKTKELVSERGYESVTTEDIATACSIGMGTMYHYFKGKKEAMAYMERDRYADALSVMDDMTFDSIDDEIRTYLEIWFSVVSKDSVNISSAWFHLALNHELPSENNGNHFADDIENLTRLISRAIERGDLLPDTPVGFITHDIVFSLNGSVFYRSIAGDAFDFSEWIDEFMENVIRVHIAPWHAATSS